MEDLKTLHDQSLQAAGQAKKAVERNSMMLQQKIAERTKLLSQLEQAKMQEQAANSLRQMTELSAPGAPPRWRMSATRSSGATQAIGQAELAQNSVQGRMLEVQESTIDMAGQNRLEQIRASLRGAPVAGEVTAGQPTTAALVGPGAGGPARPARCSSPARTDPARRGRRPPSRWAASRVPTPTDRKRLCRSDLPNTAFARSQRQARAARARAPCRGAGAGPTDPARAPVRRPRVHPVALLADGDPRPAAQALPASLEHPVLAAARRLAGRRLLGPVLVAQQQLAGQGDGPGRAGDVAHERPGESPSRKHTSAL